ncbi:MAG: 30S ribosomal protein S20 [Ruminococcus sp.]|jgi:small subunit ribosomal protein S20|nr:30S ribosomal protein S20 [Ruminococcus sp.]
MPNIKSASKRVKTQAVRAMRNKAVKSNLKSTLKKADAALVSGEGAAEAVKTAVIKLDKAASKGILHKNNVARKKSRLARQLNAAK